MRAPEVFIANATPPLSEILWNFSRFEGHARITLEQNPHFYSSLPTDESAYMPWFKFSPINVWKQWRDLRTIYVLVDRPGRVFLETKLISWSFGNVWMVNDFLVFKGLRHIYSWRLFSDVSPDHRGSLEGEQLVRLSALPGNLWYCEQRIAFPDSGTHARSDHRCMRPIMTASFATPASGRPFEDWTVLSHPASHSIHIHIYDADRFRPPGYTEDMVRFVVSSTLRVSHTPVFRVTVGPTSANASVRATRVQCTIHKCRYDQQRYTPQSIQLLSAG